MNLKGYVSIRIPVPVAVQNLVLRDYCSRNDHTLSLSDVEFVGDGFHMLQGLAGYAGRFDGICVYSMNLFPKDEAVRDLIVQGLDCPIHFALENYVLPKDLEMCETIWRLKSLI